MDFLLKFLKNLLREPAVRAIIVSTAVNGLLYGWAFLAGQPWFPAWVPDPSPVFFEVGKWIELVLAGWAASRVKRAFEAYILPMFK